jgi:hypothetical protein
VEWQRWVYIRLFSNISFVGSQVENLGDLLGSLNLEKKRATRDSARQSTMSGRACDVLQAFSHFTYRSSKRKMLVCDLQGVYSETLDTVELTDPVIHFASGHHDDKNHVYGRTDRGRKGIQDFFKTHKCNDVCAMLGLPSDN